MTWWWQLAWRGTIAIISSAIGEWPPSYMIWAAQSKRLAEKEWCSPIGLSSLSSLAALFQARCRGRCSGAKIFGRFMLNYLIGAQNKWKYGLSQTTSTFQVFLSAQSSSLLVDSCMWPSLPLNARADRHMCHLGKHNMPGLRTFNTPLLIFLISIFTHGIFSWNGIYWLSFNNSMTKRGEQ